ncbi:hypothetical protein LG047_09015 [Methylocystis sp. WRRC1]|uniref:alginate O-acetyltransferase AlgX-related protein n=1 Tax=Methylocystis sp. WRRC1 TaxID=1732014 RepID=UPI001D15A982|nr:hypothetical protein [Methylocystis sp. WRRC1]MCC3245459.1 hypothetical protein [Methylocystis sp. WRRC1]
MTDASLLVHRGREGWLFLTGGTNFVTTLYQRDGGHLPDEALLPWRDVIVERERRCHELGARFAHVVAPEKLTIYGHKQAEPLVDPELAPVIRLAQLFEGDAGAFGWVDLVTPMREYRDKVDLYWRTDTHWTPIGCLLAYETLCEAIGLQRNDELVMRPFRDFKKLMDLGSKLAPQRWEAIREVTWLKDASRVRENAVVRLLETPEFGGEIHVGCHATFRNPQAANRCKVVLFGDSFSSAGPYLLTALLAETVAELEFVWSANVDWGFVRRARPDIVVTQLAERYMALPPNDRFNLRWTEIRQAMRGRRKRFDAWRRAKMDAWRQGSRKTL